MIGCYQQSLSWLQKYVTIKTPVNVFYFYDGDEFRVWIVWLFENCIILFSIVVNKYYVVNTLNINLFYWWFIILCFLGCNFTLGLNYIQDHSHKLGQHNGLSYLSSENTVQQPQNTLNVICVIIITYHNTQPVSWWIL